MANKMLIDATHPEETRVVVLRGNRVEEFDFETAHRKQLRGNIYLAKVTRVEPSLQAAFVEYGGNRHGFLAFSEIHPDYYQIPVADRQALIEADAREARENDGEDDHHRDRGARRHRSRHRHHERSSSRRDDTVQGDAPAGEGLSAEETAQDAAEISSSDQVMGDFLQGASQSDDMSPGASAPDDQPASEPASFEPDHRFESQPEPFFEPAAQAGESENQPVSSETEAPVPSDQPYVDDHSYSRAADTNGAPQSESDAEEPSSQADRDATHADDENGNGHHGHDDEEEEIVESVGGADAMEEAIDRTPRYRRQYKIQEVIKRRQVMLVQVVKEERGTKGAALTTYLSLAGRYCVLMPNTARGGGISRKITSAEDRKKLREIAEELEVPEGMGVILRTAGAARTKAEVKRDFEYLLRLWEQVRDLTLKSTAPTLVYEEGSLAKRSIRDLYAKDIDEVVVAGDQGYQDCKEFMRMLMPSHAKNVKLYRDSQPIFTRYGIEGQLDAMFSPNVQLRSGGYIVINQTEALVAIDVNSGRSTREHHIEDTALKTNVEAAEEVARQLRLRDLAGLIVIDFIDMDEKRNNRTVERRMKEALRNDRARIQVGRISHFGLLEMSRQRIRTSVLESSTEKCPHCGGSGHLRSVSSVALQLLRSIEEMLLKGPTHNLIIRTRSEIALYVLNHKRAHLSALEQRFQVTLTINADDEVGGQIGFTIDRGEQVMTAEQARALLAQVEAATPVLMEEDEPEDADAFEDEDDSEIEHAEQADHVSDAPHDADDNQPAQAEGGHEGEPGREGGRGRKRRRRRGRGRNGDGRDSDGPSQQPHHAQDSSDQSDAGDDPAAHVAQSDSDAPHSDEAAGGPDSDHRAAEGEQSADGERRRRRRGRRGGRRNRRDHDGLGNENGAALASDAAFEPSLPDAVSVETNGRAHWAEPVESHNPPSPTEPSYRPQAEPTPQAEAVAAAAPQAQPRRRSTVREPAPVFSDASTVTPMPAPQPQPAPTVTATTANADETDKPRRTGWWAKRLLGGN